MENEVKDYNKVMLLTFFGILILFPFFIASLRQYYYYYGKDKIVIQQIFKKEKIVINYSEITEVKRYFYAHRTDKITSVHYEIYYLDKKIDILFANYWEQTLEIHNYLKIQRPDLFGIYNLSEEEEFYISKKNSKTKDKIYQIFS